MSRALDVGVAALGSGKHGPKGPTRLTEEVVAEIRARRRRGASLPVIVTAVGSARPASVGRLSAGKEAVNPGGPPSRRPNRTSSTALTVAGMVTPEATRVRGETAAVNLPVLLPAADRSVEPAACWGLLTADPVFSPAARVPLAGLLLTICALDGTGLLDCATAVFGRLRNEFYGLTRCSSRESAGLRQVSPRADGSTRSTRARQVG
jgi:hypothetical protein